MVEQRTENPCVGGSNPSLTTKACGAQLENFFECRSLNKVWSGSSVWLECWPVTPEVAGSSPVRTASEGCLPGAPFLLRSTTDTDRHPLLFQRATSARNSRNSSYNFSTFSSSSSELSATSVSTNTAFAIVSRRLIH